MNTFFGNTISKLYNAVSAPVIATRDAFAERLQGVRDTTFLFYNKIMENMGYGQQEGLKDIVEKEAEEEQPPATKKEAKEQQQDDGDYTRVDMTFTSPMTEFSEDSNISDLIECMLAHVKTQVENSRMSEGSLDKIMHLSIKIYPCQISRP